MKTMTYTDILPLWENPEIQEINRLPMRSPLMPFGSEKAALADAIGGPEFRNLKDNGLSLNLDGMWQFKLLNNPAEDLPRDDGAVPDWALPETDTASWPLIKVPGAWTRQGGNSHYENCFDKPHYTNKQMPYQAVPPQAPKENPTGLYRRKFTIPENWKDRRVVLNIGSAESVALVYINGVFSGAGKDTRLPQEYDITPFLREGENVLCIKVVRYSDASYVEDQDQWWFGGIHRSVFLYATENRYIKDIKALPGTVEQKPDGGIRGIVRLTVTLGGDLPQSRSTGNVAMPLTDAGSPFNIALKLYSFNMPAKQDDALQSAETLKPLISAEHTLVCNYRDNSNNLETEMVLDNPRLWSHEEPNLYVLTVSLFRDGRHIESTAFCTGFRTLKIANRELLINGKAVLIKGVNRHEHDEKTGKTLSIESMVRDIKLLKQHNFNAVRTSHYPDDERWYELCDRYGIYLTNEANIESHCFYDQLCNESAWTYAFISRIQRMAERDKNHPSVIVWSLGNESGDGSNHVMGAAWIRRYDPSRPVHYEGATRSSMRYGSRKLSLDTLQGGRDVTDIIPPMYPSIELITDFVKYRDDYRPLIMCEYSHAMGNSNGSLADYWKAIESHHGLQGGYIWEWIDHGLEAFTPEGKKYWKYGGDFGDLPTDYDFCLDGLIFADQSLKPGMAECRQVFAPVRLKPVPEKPFSFVLENRFDFSTLNNVELCWKLCTEDKVLAETVTDLPNIAPGGIVEISFPETPGTGDVQGILFIHADFRLKRDTPWAQAGLVIGSAERIIHERPVIPNTSQTEKALSSFAGIFKPSLFRTPTQNDGLRTVMDQRNNPASIAYRRGSAMYAWIDMDLIHLRLKNEKTEKIIRDGAPASQYTASLTAGEKASTEFRDRKLGTYTCVTIINGEKQPLIMDIRFDLDPSLPELPKIGVTARIPSWYDTISWFGAGPHESYSDRRDAAFLGLYENNVADLEVPYAVPQENGNRTGVRTFTLSGKNVPPVESKTFTVRTADSAFNMSVSRYSPENMMTALHTCDLVDVSIGAKGYYFLNIDIAQRGVGTATCGPDTREEYRIRPGTYRMRLYIA
jgi:beta-galactosidase